MKMNSVSRFWMVVLLVAAVCLPAALAAAPVATTRITPAGVEWQPAASFEKMTLTVSGPDGLVLRREFAAGVTPSFDGFGKPLGEGTYTWELSASPVLDRATRQALAASRRSGDDSIVAKLRAEGKLPQEPLVQSGSFLVSGGSFAAQEDREERGAKPATAQAKGLTPNIAEDQVIPDDLIVQGSGCFGFDCVNNESFGFDTIRLKENNLRIKFEDTSTGTFPTNDWQLTANDSASGGASKFSIEDITGAKVPFTVTAGAATNAIFVDSTGRVGFRTSTPVLDLHVSTSNTPAIRLEQNSSGGFTAQTWDIAGNEANFFVRDVTSGSRLPFRIRPGAPTSSVDISADGDVGIGTASPDNKLDVECNAADVACIKVTNLNAAGFSGFSLFDGAVETFFFGTDVAGDSNRLNSISNRPLIILTNSTERIRFPSPGTDFIQATNGAELTAGGVWQDNSSRASKRDIVELSDDAALEAFRKLNPVTFRYNAEPEEQYVGFIAEDLPDLVATSDRKHMNATDVVAVLTKVVQEQQKTIEALAAKVDQLEKANQQ
jgi:Chaperone of endosialidase